MGACFFTSSASASGLLSQPPLNHLIHITPLLHQRIRLGGHRAQITIIYLPRAHVGKAVQELGGLAETQVGEGVQVFERGFAVDQHDGELVLVLLRGM